MLKIKEWTAEFTKYFNIFSGLVLQDGEGGGEIGDNDSVGSGSGQYRTYTPPPMLDEATMATGVDSSPEGVVISR